MGLEDSTFTVYSSDTPAVASVDQRGMVTAVAAGHANITIKYTSPSGGSISARVPVGVSAPLVVLPEKSSIYASQTEELAASLSIDPSLDQSVTWSIHPALGSIDNRGRYTAPAALSSWQGVTVTATSVAEPKISASAKIWVFPPIAVQITPPAATLSAGRFQDFYANIVNGGFNVKWTLTPAGMGHTPHRSNARSGHLAAHGGGHLYRAEYHHFGADRYFDRDQRVRQQQEPDYRS